MNVRALSAALVVTLTLVATGCQGYFVDSPRRTAGEATDDRGIHTAVKTKLFSHGETRGWKINVDVFRSNVILRGYVRSEAERATAVQLARDTKGVQGVDDQLVVLPQNQPPQN